MAVGIVIVMVAVMMEVYQVVLVIAIIRHMEGQSDAGGDWFNATDGRKNGRNGGDLT
jgi:hypothetical protein